MWEEIVRSAASNGIWAVMFVWLLFYLLNDSRKREQRYQDLITELTERLETLVEVRDDVKVIKDSVTRVPARARRYAKETV